MRSDQSNDICPELDQLIEGYALGALEADQMLFVANNVGSCPEQRDRLHQYEETVGALGLSARPVDPPSGLWVRLQESTGPESLPDPVSIEQRRSRLRTVPGWVAAALTAAALLLFVTSISLGVALRRENDDADAASMNSTMTAYLTSGGTMIPLASQAAPEYMTWPGKGTLLISPDMPPVLFVDKCAPTSKDFDYVVWLQSGDQRTPMGSMQISEDGRGMMQIEGIESIETYDTIGISIKTNDNRIYDVMEGSPSKEN